MNKIQIIGNVIASLILLILILVGCAASAEQTKNTKNAATQCITNGGQWIEFKKGFYTCVGAR